MGPFGEVKAVAFDLDETLIDFKASRRAGLDAMLARIAGAGYRVSREHFLARYRELIAADDAHYLATGKWRPTEERLRELALEFGMPSDGFARELNEVYLRARYANLRVFPETPGTLRRLNERYPLYLVTNGPSAPQHREIEVTGVAPYFARLFVCDDFGLHKPQEAIFEMIRAEAQVEPHEMMIVGDLWGADIEVPRKLGWRTVWVVKSRRERGTADASRADAVVASVAEVPGLLGLGR